MWHWQVLLLGLLCITGICPRSLTGWIPRTGLPNFVIGRWVLVKLGGWQDSITSAFSTYARTCFESFGDRVKHWITLNECRTQNSHDHAAHWRHSFRSGKALVQRGSSLSASLAMLCWLIVHENIWQVLGYNTGDHAPGHTDAAEYVAGRKASTLSVTTQQSASLEGTEILAQQSLLPSLAFY